MSLSVFFFLVGILLGGSGFIYPWFTGKLYSITELTFLLISVALCYVAGIVTAVES